MYPENYEIDSAVDTLKRALKESGQIARESEAFLRSQVYFLEERVRKLEDTLNKVIEFLPPEVKLGLELTKGE